MNVLNHKYYDDNGNAVSQEEFEFRYAEFVSAYKKKYEQVAECIVKQINTSCKTNREKLLLLFDYLTNSNMKYDLADTSANGRRASHPGYQFLPYGKFWRIEQSTKYPALLFNSGICGSYSKTFEDLCKKLNIPCKVVTGNAGMDHAWNVILEDGELKHIDISYAIMNRNTKNKMNYFMKSFAELQQICGNRSMNQNSIELINELAHQFKVLSRSDINRPSFSVVNRTDESINSRPSFRVVNRTDESINSRSKKG